MNRRSALAALHGGALLFGLTGVFGKLASASPGVIVFGRALFAVLALGLFARLAGQAWRALGSAQWLRLALCGLLLAGHWVSFFIAVKTAGVAIATLGFASFPAFTVILEGLLFRERIHLAEGLLVVLVSLGLVLVTPNFDLASGATLGLLWAILSGLLFALLLGAVFFSIVYQVDQFTVHPGRADTVVDRLAVTGTDTFESAGEILFLTVQLDDDVNIWEWGQAKLDDSIDLREPQTVLGDRTEEESRQFNLELMQTSKSNAVLLALARLGYDVFDEIGAGVSAVEPDTAADGTLEPGDVIVGVEDVAVFSGPELVEVLRETSPGDVVRFDVLHPDTGERSIEVTLGERPEDSPGPGGFLGISVTTAIDEAELPVDVDVDTGQIGGNSAGLALTLTVLDALTEGDLTNGNRVAVTGTIGLNGDVGNVGGVKQKAIAADRADVDLMIVPVELLPTAEEHSGDVPVVGVATLDDALAALAELGGNVDELALPAGS